MDYEMNRKPYALNAEQGKRVIGSIREMRYVRIWHIIQAKNVSCLSQWLIKTEVTVMKEFEVTITETLQKTVSIEAETKEEAKQLVEDMWKDGDIILDADDFADVEYAADNDKEIIKLNELEVLLVEPGQYAFSALFALRKVTAAPCLRVFAVPNNHYRSRAFFYAGNCRRKYSGCKLL